MRPSTPVRLLDLDEGFAAALGSTHRAAAEQVALPAFELDPGPWEVGDVRRAPGVRGRALGFFVESGVITTEVTIDRRRPCMRLLSQRDLVLLDGVEQDALPARWRWRAESEVRLAVLDERLLAAVARWPRLLEGIAAHAAQQPRQALLQQAISQLPRVEDRLLSFLWSLADRYGRVSPEGVDLELGLTHETLGRMIGAQRPTVSLGLKRLAGDGLIEARPRGWRLCRDPGDELARLVDGPR